MDINTYIKSGILEEYCFGLLNDDERAEVEKLSRQHPLVQQYILQASLELENFARKNAVTVDLKVKENIFKVIENELNENRNTIHSFPEITPNSDYNNWLTWVSPHLPEKLEDNMFVKELKNDGRVSQILIWTKVNYPDEVHTDEKESFIILKGRCKCYIEEKEIELGPGGIIEIPLYKHHDVKILSDEVIAVVQRKKIA